MSVTGTAPRLQGVHVCSHDIRVRGVGQPQRPSVVLPIQRRLFRVQLVQSAPDVSTLQQSLAVLRKLHEEEHSLINMMPPPPDALITDENLRWSVTSSHCWSVRKDSGQPGSVTSNKPDYVKLNTDHESFHRLADVLLLLFQAGNLCSYCLELLPHTHL